MKGNRFTLPGVALITTLVLVAQINCAGQTPGTKLWEVQLTTGQSSVVAAGLAIGVDGTIYALSGTEAGWTNTALYAVSGNGNKQWQASVGGMRLGTPVVGSDGTIYLLTSMPVDKLYAIRSSGRIKWEFDLGFSNAGIGSSDALSIGSDGTIYVAAHVWKNPGLFAVSTDGVEKWRFSTQQTVQSCAVGLDGTIYVGAEKMYALKPDGSLIWSFSTGIGTFYPGSISSGIAIEEDGRLLFGANNGKLYSVFPNGSAQWELKLGDVAYSSPAIGYQDVIYSGTGWQANSLLAVDSAGHVLWKSTNDQVAASSSAVTADATIYCISLDGNLNAFSNDGRSKWSSPIAGGATSFVVSLASHREGKRRANLRISEGNRG